MQNDITIHDLKCVIVVAQEGSLSRAAARLHMTQPALGRRIHHVEAEVGVRLFYSWYGGVQLTESGKVFVEESLKSVDHWERAAQRARNVAHARDGLFQVAYSSFLSPELLDYHALGMLPRGYPESGDECELRGARMQLEKLVRED